MDFNQLKGTIDQQLNRLPGKYLLVKELHFLALYSMLPGDKHRLNCISGPFRCNLSMVEQFPINTGSITIEKEWGLNYIGTTYDRHAYYELED